MIESVIEGDERVNKKYKEEIDFRGRGDKNYTRDTQNFYQRILLFFKIQYCLKYTIFSCKELEKLNCRESKGIESEEVFNGYFSIHLCSRISVCSHEYCIFHVRILMDICLLYV